MNKLDTMFFAVFSCPGKIEIEEPAVVGRNITFRYRDASASSVDWMIGGLKQPSGHWAWHQPNGYSNYDLQTTEHDFLLIILNSSIHYNGTRVYLDGPNGCRTAVVTLYLQRKLTMLMIHLLCQANSYSNPRTFLYYR